MTRLALAVVCLVAGGAAIGCRADTPVATTGPKDGAGLAPDDRSRVRLGDPAPDFTLENAEGRRVTLSDLRGTFVVLVFYRGHW